MRWYDLRIEFRDLNDIRALNSLSNNDKENIWVPQLDFVNALGATQARFIIQLPYTIIVLSDLAGLKTCKGNYSMCYFKVILLKVVIIRAWWTNWPPVS